MKEAKNFVQRTVRHTLFIALVWALLWVIVPKWKSILSALAIGTGVSVYFALSLARQVNAAVTVALQGEKKKPGFPLVSRIAVIALAVMIADKLAYPNVPVMILAFFTYLIVIFVDMFVRRGRKDSKPEGVK